MRLNESTAVSTPKVLLVPYDRRHVLTYHAWMEDPAIQEATASERLTLDEEYENQASWRASHDKLTFIACQPLAPPPPAANDRSGTAVQGGAADAPGRMVGDVNLFLYPYEGEDDGGGEGEGGGGGADDGPGGARELEFCVGEVDIMIADRRHRGKGVGRAVMRAFLQYLARNVDGVMAEYARDKGVAVAPRLKLLMAKVSEGNGGSIALFGGLGFVREGGVNYFGEVTLVLRALEVYANAGVPEGYAELVYLREGKQDEQL
ncbi:hypothetical protein BT67DRAFT_446751 [Trichocladium antarcticum]|uniref:N-acetyltransferase domain-containing protein n=1 Tax=Trichocladium antarcticum TaxID=1450529 RepID=A0AAN6UTD2_9PEZI|nr:hypothetical protein BT67DRAFT_446751 [Trichocladium antarcticum]